MKSIKQWLRYLYDVQVKRDPKSISYYNYLNDNGELLRTDYHLDEESVVIDVGGYTGDFAAQILKKFNCRIDVFEPVAQYAKVARDRFASFNNVNVIQAGLGACEKNDLISIEGLGSSVFNNGTDGCMQETIKIHSVIDYIDAQNFSEIGLIKINIEGGEYELLNSILNRPDITKIIRYLQIQFHDFIPNSQKMRLEIQEKLSKTHILMWNYPFIWESWEIKQQ